jgi:flagellar biosynthetic protein FliS
VNKEDYVLRIAQATPVQLVIINHELLVAFIDDALSAIEKGETDLFHQNISKAKDALTQLIDGLDPENPIARKLSDLYLFAGERLNKALFGNDPEAAFEVSEMFKDLLEGWQAIENTPDDRLTEAPAQSGPQVYAGLTYGKDGLSEYIPDSGDSGFKA